MNLNYQDHFKKMREDPDYKMEHLKKIKEQQKERFLTIKPFEKAEDIPELPTVDDKEWQEYYVPILIKNGAIAKKDLIEGTWYYGEHRRCNFAKWNGTDFDYIRYKFGFYWDKCNHFQDDDGYALFVPIRKATDEEIETQTNNIK